MWPEWDWLNGVDVNDTLVFGTTHLSAPAELFDVNPTSCRCLNDGPFNKAPRSIAIAFRVAYKCFVPKLRLRAASPVVQEVHEATFPDKDVNVNIRTYSWGTLGSSGRAAP